MEEEVFDSRMTDSPADGRYRGQRIALLTQHGKEAVLAPRFHAQLGAIVQRVSGYDTDQLGAFTREIPRAGTQREAARQKARIGMELAGLPVGLASEGAFGPDPFTGMASWNVEMLVLIDDRLGIEVVGESQAPGHHHHRTVHTLDALEAFAREAGFPSHHLVLRPDDEHDRRIRKGLDAWDALRAGFDWAQKQSRKGAVFVETDLRAHANPTRMETIASAADDLIRRMRSACPACRAPGFAAVEHIAGLPCADCGHPTAEPLAERWACVKCDHAEVRSLPSRTVADPASCDLCNP
jgi:hypothetical protein